MYEAACAIISPFRHSNTAGNKPAAGWFLFLQRVCFTIKMYYMLLYFQGWARNVFAELAAPRIP